MDSKLFVPREFISSAIIAIKEQVGDGKAVNLLSGGVDSAVVDVLARKALGDNLTSIFIDTGLMRKDEAKKIKAIFPEVQIVEAEYFFLKELEGKIDPDKEKRPAFSDTFYEIAGAQIKQHGAIFIFQGTNEDDVKETTGLKLVYQHNVRSDFSRFGIEHMVEPVITLVKDQIRQVARLLGLPPEICERIPFPGPGLAVRIIGEVTRKKVEIVREATAIVEEELADSGAFQYFAILTNSLARGIIDGKRTYGHVITLRCVNGENAARAIVTPLSWEKLDKITSRIIEEVPGITRVVYDITSKKSITEGPGSIEWE